MEEDFSKYNGEGSTLRKAQLRMLDILVEVDKICRKHNITYWLDFGTLLGAIRHKGFIPWDDDLDISVMRKDYKRLRKALQKELPQNLIFQDETTEKYYAYKFWKVRDKNSKIIDLSWNDKVKELGLYIDIFPIERGAVKMKTFVDFFYGRAFRRIKYFNENNKKERCIAYFIWPFVSFLVLLVRMFSFIVPQNLLIHSYGSYNGMFQLKKTYIFPLTSISFEGKEFSCVANPDRYLKELYGNYMEIPPEDKRRVHASEIIFYD